MAGLSENWITEKRIDFEYKKYLLLGYLQEVSNNFTETKLYPSLSELVNHYRNVISLRDRKHDIFNSFPERLAGTDLNDFNLIYEKMLADDQIMAEIGEIIEFSIPQFEKYIQEGKAIYDHIEAHMNIFPVGIMPLRTDEGYLMLSYSPGSDTLVYEYQISIFESPDEKYRSISTRFLGSFQPSLHYTFENIKLELIRYHHKMPNPATFAIESEIQVPLQETLLPLARRALVKYVATNSPGS